MARRDTSDNCLGNSLALQTLTVFQGSVTGASPASENDTAVVFQLLNPALDVDAQCAAHSTALTPNGRHRDPSVWYNCFVESRDTTISAKFQFDTVANKLTVNETWECTNATTSFTYVAEKPCFDSEGLVGRETANKGSQCALPGLWLRRATGHV